MRVGMKGRGYVHDEDDRCEVEVIGRCILELEVEIKFGILSKTKDITYRPRSNGKITLGLKRQSSSHHEF